MFPAYEKFETRLIFIADDNYQFVNHFTRADVERIHQKIRTMKLGVESGQFTKNTDLCSRCRFADVDEQCIVK
jgi:hypothetical protein